MRSLVSRLRSLQGVAGVSLVTAGTYVLHGLGWALLVAGCLLLLAAAVDFYVTLTGGGVAR